jgi:hypothetical protein
MKWLGGLILLFAGAFCFVGSSSQSYSSLWAGPSAVVRWEGLWGADKPVASTVSVSEAPRWVGYYKKDDIIFFRLILNAHEVVLTQGASAGAWKLESVDFRYQRPVRITLTNGQSWNLTLEK